MSDQYRDPSGDTQAFRAFVQRPEPPAEPTRSMLPWLIAGGVAVVLIAVLALLLIVG